MQALSIITDIIEWIRMVVLGIGDRIVMAAHLLPNAQPVMLMIVALALIAAVAASVRLIRGSR